MPISEFWVTIGDRFIFFTVPLSKIIFLPKSVQGNFFRKKNQAPPPPEYQMDRAQGEKEEQRSVWKLFVVKTPDMQ